MESDKEEEKKTFTIDVGNMPEEDVEAYVKKVAKQFKENPEMYNSNYFMQQIPNSHAFGSLANIVQMFAMETESHYLTKDYLVTGLKNSLDNGYEMHIPDNGSRYMPYFNNIKELIYYIENNDIDSKLLFMLNDSIENECDLKCERKMERTEVYECLNTERDYQDLRWSPRREKNNTPDKDKQPAEWINYMEYHLAKAKEEIYFLNEEDALGHVRKVAALGVRCMELHGCPERIIPEELIKD